MLNHTHIHLSLNVLFSVSLISHNSFTYWSAAICSRMISHSFWSLNVGVLYNLNLSAITNGFGGKCSVSVLVVIRMF